MVRYPGSWRPNPQRDTAPTADRGPSLGLNADTGGHVPTVSGDREREAIDETSVEGPGEGVVTTQSGERQPHPDGSGEPGEGSDEMAEQRQRQIPHGPDDVAGSTSGGDDATGEGADP